MIEADAVRTALHSEEYGLNVNILNNVPTTAYGSATAARAAVGADYRQQGLKITYLLSTGWITDQYVGTALDNTSWGTAANWKTIGPVSVLQNTETGDTNIIVGNRTIPVPNIEKTPKINNSGYDFSISDENNNCIIGFKDGHLKTKHFDSKKIEHPVETDINMMSDLSITDESAHEVLRLRKGHIKTKYFDSAKVVKKPYERRIAFTVKVDATNFLASNFVSVDVNTIETPFYCVDNCVLYLPDSYTQQGKSTPLVIYCKQGDSIIKPEVDSYDMLNKVETKLIFHYLLSLGYAILGVDGVPDAWRDELKIQEGYAVGNYVAVQSTLKAYQYVLDNYNISKNGVALFGMSMGGLTAFNLIENTEMPINCAALAYPVVSMRYHIWDGKLTTPFYVDGVPFYMRSRYNIGKIFGFTFEDEEELEALNYDYFKTAGYDPWYKNVDDMYQGFTKSSPYGRSLYALQLGTSIDDITMKKLLRCPVKAWVADNDNVLGADVTKVFFKALKNAGVSCDIQCYTTGGHAIQSNQTAIGTFTEHGNTYNLMPIAKDVADWLFLNGVYYK